VKPSEQSELFVSSDHSIVGVRVGDLWLTATDQLAISDEAWIEKPEFLVRLVADHGPVFATFNWCPQHGANSYQRGLLTKGKYAEAIVVSQVRRSAIMTNSVLVRGTLTAINWLTGGKMDTRAFSPAELRTALDWTAAVCPFDRGLAERAQAILLETVRVHERAHSL